MKFKALKFSSFRLEMLFGYVSAKVRTAQMQAADAEMQKSIRSCYALLQLYLFHD